MKFQNQIHRHEKLMTKDQIALDPTNIIRKCNLIWAKCVSFWLLNVWNLNWCDLAKYINEFTYLPSPPNQIKFNFRSFFNQFYQIIQPFSTWKKIFRYNNSNKNAPVFYSLFFIYSYRTKILLHFRCPNCTESIQCWITVEPNQQMTSAKSAFQTEYHWNNMTKFVVFYLEILFVAGSISGSRDWPIHSAHTVAEMQML